MSDDEFEHENQDQQRSVVGIWAVVILVASLFAYAMGIGPAVWICNQRPAAAEYIYTVYTPLDAVVTGGPLEPFFRHYVEFWDGL